MNNSHFARNSFTKTWLTISIAAVALLLVVHSASAALLFTWKQTGSDVTATVSGTIDAAWGIPAKNTNPNGGPLEGGFGSYFSDLYLGGPYLKYGSVVGFDVYYIETFFVNSSISNIAGFLVEEGGVVQEGSLPYLVFEVNTIYSYLWLEVPTDTTTIDATVVWSDKPLTDFFTAGVPVRSEIFNSSDQLLMTLEIGEFAPEPIPEPGTWAAAALLVGGAAFMRWRRRQTA